MAKYVARRIRFRNGERISVLKEASGLPIQEVTLFLERFRRKGRSANTIHAVCMTLALLYRVLEVERGALVKRLSEGRFLSAAELGRLASSAQFRVDDLGEGGVEDAQQKVVNILRFRFRKKSSRAQRRSVDIATQATRLRYMAEFLEFLSGYVGSSLPKAQCRELELETARALKAFRAHIPSVSRRAKLDARVGLSQEEQSKFLQVVQADSPKNPWVRDFVRKRNWLIVVLLLATGMRRGELLGLQIGDLASNAPKLRIIRRADALEDQRRIQPNAKTHDREIELTTPIMRALWHHINVDRRAIKAARRIPQIFVSEDGEALSLDSIDKIFVQIREACPGLPVRLTSHVMRHTWNERFSEQAEAMGLSERDEEQARNSQQGWSDNSKMGATYTRRHTAKKGREISLKLQKRLEADLDVSK